MSTSLYQKYRPTTFEDVVGQDHITTTLQNEIRAKKWSHAYLFSGSRGIGKTTTARLLARAVNCLSLAQNSSDAEPCNECVNCVSALNGKALDIIEIDAASNTGVDNVRENVIENARVAPGSFPWKVFIIDEVHMLSTSAFNALLKTLEEPPSRTLFILATTEVHKVPATIASRCEQFQFRRVSTPEIATTLKKVAEREGMQIADDAVMAIAKRADGGLRDAESLLGQVLSTEAAGEVSLADVEKVLPHADLKEVVGLIAELVTGKSGAAMIRAGNWHQAGVQMQQYLLSIVEVLRLGMIYRVSGSADTFNALILDNTQKQFLTTLFDRWSVRECQRSLEVFLHAASQQKTTAIASLPLEMAIATLSVAMETAAVPTTPTTPATITVTQIAAPVTPIAGAAVASVVATPVETVEGTMPAVTDPALTPAPAAASIDDVKDQFVKPNQLASTKKVKSEEAAAEDEQLPVIQLDDESPEAAVLGSEPETEVEDDASHEEGEESGNDNRNVEPTEVVAATVDIVQELAGQPQLETMNKEDGAAKEQEESTEIVTTETTEPVSAGEVSSAAVAQHWPTLLEKIRESDQGLYLTMKVGQIASVENGIITFGFEYGFYKDRLEDAGNRTVLENIFSGVLGGKVSIDAIVSTEFAKDHDDIVENIIEPSQDEVANVWDLATQQFGPKLSES